MSAKVPLDTSGHARMLVDLLLVGKRLETSGIAEALKIAEGFERAAKTKRILKQVQKV
jgi:hypothetical protein